METDRINGFGKAKKENVKNTVKRTKPAIAAVSLIDGSYTLFLHRLTDGKIKEVRFCTPDRCENQNDEITFESLQKFSSFLKGFFKKETVVATVFLTDETQSEYFWDFDCHKNIIKERLYLQTEDETCDMLHFGADRRKLTVKLLSASILFDKALFIDLTKKRGEAFFCENRKINSVFTFDLSKNENSLDKEIEKILFTPSEISDFAVKFSADTVFILAPYYANEEIYKISDLFKKDEINFPQQPLFYRLDQKDIALFAAKTLASTVKQAMSDQCCNRDKTADNEVSERL